MMKIKLEEEEEGVEEKVVVVAAAAAAIIITINQTKKLLAQNVSSLPSFCQLSVLGSINTNFRKIPLDLLCQQMTFLKINLNDSSF